jgi:hypothetical protein
MPWRMGACNRRANPSGNVLIGESCHNQIIPLYVIIGEPWDNQMIPPHHGRAPVAGLENPMLLRAPAHLACDHSQGDALPPCPHGSRPENERRACTEQSQNFGGFMEGADSGRGPAGRGAMRVWA